MSEASQQTVQQQMQQAAPEKKSGCGKCCLVSCLGVIVLTVVSVVAAVVLVPRYVRSLREKYTDTEPMALPEVQATEQEVARIKRRLDDFGKAVETPGAPATLVLTADDINKLIANDPQWQKSPVRCYVTIEGDKITGQFSISFDGMAKSEDDRKLLEKLGLAGRYLNASGTIKVSLENGVLVVILDQATVRGNPVPGFIMSKLRQKNLAEDLPRQNPDLAEALQKLESIEVKDGRIIIRSKGGGTQDPGAPPPTPNASAPARRGAARGGEDW